MRRSILLPIVRPAVLTSIFAIYAMSSVRAQSLPDADVFLSPTPISRLITKERTRQDTGGISAEGWMLYPTLLVGTAIDDNLYQTSIQRTSAIGARINPAILAIQDNGLHKTTLYAALDARSYPGNANANVYNGNAGAEHIWEVERGTIVRFLADYSHKTDMTNNGVILTPTGPVTNITPQQYHQFNGSTSINKTLGSYFVSLGGQIVDTRYDTATDTLGQTLSQSYRDGVTYMVAGRGGFWFGPAIFVFVEPSGNFRRFQTGIHDSNGYRVVSGLGTERIDLMKGEIYAGYQQQNYLDAPFGHVSGDVFGGKLSWFPTKDITLTGILDETIGDATAFTPTNPNGSATHVTTSGFKANYKALRQWEATANFTYSDTSYVQTTRRDNRYDAGIRFDYELYRNFGLALDYTYSRVNSNVTLISFTRNIVTLGATYKY